jgi:hypothetical protein
MEYLGPKRDKLAVNIHDLGILKDNDMYLDVERFEHIAIGDDDGQLLEGVHYRNPFKWQFQEQLKLSRQALKTIHLIFGNAGLGETDPKLGAYQLVEIHEVFNWYVEPLFIVTGAVCH